MEAPSRVDAAWKHRRWATWEHVWIFQIYGIKRAVDLDIRVNLQQRCDFPIDVFEPIPRLGLQLVNRGSLSSNAGHVGQEPNQAKPVGFVGVTGRGGNLNPAGTDAVCGERNKLADFRASWV